MWFFRISVAISLSILVTAVTAQDSVNHHAIRFSVDNDFLNFRMSGTDRYFTNGIRIDYFYQGSKRRFPVNLLLSINEERNGNTYGLGLAQFMFTPSTISVKEIQYDDRPYAGALYGIYSLQSIDKQNKLKLSSEIYFGVIGPLSLADKTQTMVHRALNYTIPEGWDNQVPNDVILNYNISVEKPVLRPAKSISVSGVAETFSGTLYNSAGAGFFLKVGKFEEPFDIMPINANAKMKTLKAFVFMRPTVRIILSNALLQGGIISRISQNDKGYYLEKDKIKRIGVLYDVGLALDYRKFSFSLTQKLRSSEFEGQKNQEIGTVALLLKL